MEIFVIIRLLLSTYFAVRCYAAKQKAKGKANTTKPPTTSTRRTIKKTSTSKTMTTTTSAETTTTQSSESSISSLKTITSKETTKSQRTWMSTSTKARAPTSTSTPITPVNGLRTTQAENTNILDNATLSTRQLPVTSDGGGSVVVPVVSVFLVIVVIALAAAIVFLLWRHRRLRHQIAKVNHSGKSISNRSYEDNHGLNRHISLLDIRPDNSVDSGYAEISPGNFYVEEGSGNVYQTIDNLPEDKAAYNHGYGHLMTQTSKFIDNNYSHVADNQNGKPSSFATNAHTGNPLNTQELKGEGENQNTYNHTEKNARKTRGIQQPIQIEEKKVFDDFEAEYDHAKAGNLALEPQNKGDTFSHLNSTQNSRGVQRDDLKCLTHDSKTQTNGTETLNLESDKDDRKNTFPEYAKSAENINKKEAAKQVGCHSYEAPAENVNNYFTLEPESKLADADVSFQVTNKTFEDSESDESSYHQYYILQKADK